MDNRSNSNIETLNAVPLESLDEFAQACHRLIQLHMDGGTEDEIETLADRLRVPHFCRYIFDTAQPEMDVDRFIERVKGIIIYTIVSSYDGLESVYTVEMAQQKAIIDRAKIDSVMGATIPELMKFIEEDIKTYILEGEVVIVEALKTVSKRLTVIQQQGE